MHLNIDMKINVERISCRYRYTYGSSHTHTHTQEFPRLFSGKKNPPAMQESWLRSLGQENPLEKEMATYSSILAWKIPWAEESGGLQSMGS